MPDAAEHSSPDTWRLSADGRAAAAVLRRALPADALLCASEEPKAWETLGGSDSVRRDARFNEVARTGEPWEGAFRELRLQYVQGVAHPGWEAHVEAAASFDAGVLDALDPRGTAGRPVVIASHGMVMTTWLVSRGIVQAEKAGDFWSDLRFPDCLLVDTEAASAQRLPT